MIDADGPQPKSEVVWGAIGRGLVRCVVLALAMVAVVSVAGVMIMVSGMFISWLSGPQHRTGDSGGVILLAFAILYWPILGLFCALLGSPFLLFQGWIVKPQFPFLRWGYVAVAIYGPMLLVLWAWPWTDTSTYGILIAYEVVALAGTMLYARIGRSAGVFGDELGTQGSDAGTPTTSRTLGVDDRTLSD